MLRNTQPGILSQIYVKKKIEGNFYKQNSDIYGIWCFATQLKVYSLINLCFFTARIIGNLHLL